MRLFLQRIYVWLFGGELVWIKWASGDVTSHVAHRDAWGELTVKYGPYYMETCVLGANTVVFGAAGARWKPVE